MLSYIVAGIVCIFAALCYAEFASMVPVAGSATVANGWSGYFQSVLNSLGIPFPASLGQPLFHYDAATGELVGTGAYINLPAVLFVIGAGAFYVNADNWTPFVRALRLHGPQPLRLQRRGRRGHGRGRHHPRCSW